MVEKWWTNIFLMIELASGSEDEKRLKKATEAASRRRRQPRQRHRGPDKKFKETLTD